LPNCIRFVDVVNTLGKINLEDWFDSVINPRGEWIIIFGFQNFMSRGLPHNVNTLRYMSPFDGFWIKIKKGIGDVALCIESNPFQSGCGINLTKGWNLLGFPINKGFYDSDSHPEIPWINDWEKVPYPVGKAVFWSIYDNISFIFSGSESFNPLLSKQANSLHHIIGGSGYWIKLKADDELIYGPEP